MLRGSGLSVIMPVRGTRPGEEVRNVTHDDNSGGNRRGGGDVVGTVHNTAVLLSPRSGAGMLAIGTGSRVMRVVRGWRGRSPSWARSACRSPV